MSTKIPAPLSMRRSLLLVALSLSAIVLGCDSEETGYEVSIPLIGPIEFDGSACEISGEVCATDDDCVDEDGFFTGPCTKAMDELQPITVPVSLSPSNPSYTLGFVDTRGWTNVLTAQQFGDDGVGIEMTMDDFFVNGGPVTIAVEIFSKIGLVAMQPTGYQPVRPASCVFTIDDSSSGQDYADGIHTCLNDWISANGAPIELDMTVTSSAGTVAAGLAPKSSFATKQDGYSVEGQWTMKTDSQCDYEESADVLEAIREGEDFFERLTCEELTLNGSGNTDQDLDSIHGYAFVWDRCGNPSAAILGPTSLAAGEYSVAVQEDGAVDADVPVFFLPDSVDFTASLLGAATGKCLSGTPILPDGAAYAGWHHCGPSPPPARTGFIQVSSDGFCSVVEGPNGMGGSGQ